MFRGVFVIVVVWAMLIAGVAKIARDRNRSIVAWAAAAAVAGAAAFVLGGAMFQQFMDDEVGDMYLLFSVLLPPAFLVASIGGIWLHLHRSHAVVSQTNEWKVHFINRGEGRIVIANGEVQLVWGDGADEARRCVADGQARFAGGTATAESGARASTARQVTTGI